MKSRELNKSDIAQWVVIAILSVVIVGTCYSLKMAHIEISAQRNMNHVNMIRNENLRQCIKNKDAECDFKNYASDAEYLQNISSEYKKFPAPGYFLK